MPIRRSKLNIESKVVVMGWVPFDQSGRMDAHIMRIHAIVLKQITHTTAAIPASFSGIVWDPVKLERDRHTDRRQVDRHTGTQAIRETDKQKHNHINGQTDTAGQTDRQAGRQNRQSGVSMGVVVVVIPAIHLVLNAQKIAVHL